MPIRTPTTAGVPITIAATQSMWPLPEKRITPISDVRISVAREVAAAIRAGIFVIRIRSGTITTPPPIPNIAANSPETTPIATYGSTPTRPIWVSRSMALS